MKKGKVFGKAQIALVLMAVALGAAVWLNMNFSSKKYLGEATYVDNTSGSAIQTSASAKNEEEKTSDRFTQAVKDREKAYEKAKDAVEEMLDTDKLTDADKQSVLTVIRELAERIEKENNIETLLKAKGFEKAVAVIGDNNITVLVSSDGITTAQSMQIQDIIIAETGISLGNIKIVAVK